MFLRNKNLNIKNKYPWHLFLLCGRLRFQASLFCYSKMMKLVALTLVLLGDAREVKCFKDGSSFLWWNLWTVLCKFENTTGCTPLSYRSRWNELAVIPHSMLYFVTKSVCYCWVLPKALVCFSVYAILLLQNRFCTNNN